ncbi:MAG: hypothetical protein R3F60_31910 [bacterium]
MSRRYTYLLIFFQVALTAGCGREADPSAKAAAPSSATPELRAAWRDSVKYRSAHQALVSNLESLKADEARLDRELAESHVLARIPISSLEMADSGEATAYLKLHADRLGIGRMDQLKLTTVPGPPPPPVQVEAGQGIHYDEAQVVGEHTLRFDFASREDAERFIRGLSELDRLPVLDDLEEVEGGGIRVTGRVRFFRDLPYTRIVADAKDVDAILAGLGMTDATGQAAELAAKLRENYAEVARLGAPLVEAYQLEARLKLKSTRLAIFKKHARDLERSTWEALTAPKK